MRESRVHRRLGPGVWRRRRLDVAEVDLDETQRSSRRSSLARRAALSLALRPLDRGVDSGDLVALILELLFDLRTQLAKLLFGGQSLRARVVERFDLTIELDAVDVEPFEDLCLGGFRRTQVLDPGL